MLRSIRSFPQQTRFWLPVFFGVAALVIGLGAGLLVIGVPDALKLFVIVIGLFAFVASVARVEWGLLVLVFITYTRFSDIAIKYHGAPSTAKSFIFLLLFAILLRWAAYGEKPRGWVRPALHMAIFGLVGYLTILYAVDPQRTSNASMDYFKDAIIVVIVAILMQRVRTLRQVVWTLLAAGIFMGTISVIQYVTGTFTNNYWGFAQAPIEHIVGETSGHRVSGPIGDPNFYAQIMLPLIPLALDRLWNEKKRGLRLIALFTLIVCFLTVIFTFSRGAFVAMIAMLGVMLLFNPPRPIALAITILLGLVLIRFIPNEYSARMATLTDFFSQETSTTPPGDASIRGRTSEILVGWMMFRDHPILGVGYNNYPVHYQSYSRQLGLDPRIEQRSAHNLYIEIAAETGLLGLTAFGILVFGALRGLWATWKMFRNFNKIPLGTTVPQAKIIAAFGVGLIGYLMAGMFIHDAYPRFLWMLIAIAFAMPNIAREELGIIHLW
jgi:O-antigen ligase